jgi:hypothetical protein
MKSVPNLISYLHKIFWIFSQFLSICSELFSSGSKFNSEIADMRGPPVSHRFPRRARLSARRHRVAATRSRRAIKASTDSASPLSEPRRRLASPTPVPTAPSSVSEPRRRRSWVRAAVLSKRARRHYLSVSALPPRHYRRHVHWFLNFAILTSCSFACRPPEPSHCSRSRARRCRTELPRVSSTEASVSRRSGPHLGR